MFWLISSPYCNQGADYAHHISLSSPELLTFWWLWIQFFDFCVNSFDDSDIIIFRHYLPLFWLIQCWKPPNVGLKFKMNLYFWIVLWLLNQCEQGSQLEGENLPSRPISSSSSLLHPYYSQNFKKIPRSGSKSPCLVGSLVKQCGAVTLDLFKKVIYLSFDEKKIHYIKSSSFSSDI